MIAHLLILGATIASTTFASDGHSQSSCRQEIDYTAFQRDKNGKSEEVWHLHRAIPHTLPSAGALLNNRTSIGSWVLI
jgi:hypothetical protein